MLLCEQNDVKAKLSTTRRALHLLAEHSIPLLKLVVPIFIVDVLHIDLKILCSKRIIGVLKGIGGDGTRGFGCIRERVEPPQSNFPIFARPIRPREARPTFWL